MPALDLAGLFAPALIYAAILALHLLLPARVVDGYVRNANTGEPLRYRLNGLSVLFIAVLAWVLVGWLGWLPFDWLYHHRWSGLAGALVIGLGFSAWIVVPAPSTGEIPPMKAATQSSSSSPQPGAKRLPSSSSASLTFSRR